MEYSFTHVKNVIELSINYLDATADYVQGVEKDTQTNGLRSLLKDYQMFPIGILSSAYHPSYGLISNKTGPYGKSTWTL